MRSQDRSEVCECRRKQISMTCTHKNGQNVLNVNGRDYAAKRKLFKRGF